jgi:hypothetical protein
VTLGRPSAVVTVDGRRLTSAEGAVVRVRVRLGRGPAHDDAECVCWPSSKLASASAGSTLAIALGNAGDETDVWTGEVMGVRRAPDGLALEGLAASVALSRTFLSQTFVDLSIADVVRQLAAAAGVPVDEASGDTTLSAYAVDDRRSAWAHLNDLAELAGADVTVTEAGALKFAAPAPAAGGGGLGGLVEQAAALVFGGGASGLRYGANVLGWRATTRKAPDSASVAAYGAASESGSAKWHWIRRDPDPAGSGPTRIVPAFRTRDAAGALADALSTRAGRAARRATVVVVGDATLRPGQTTTIADIPGDPGGDLRLLAVEHALDGDAGFVSRLVVEPAS